MLTPDQLIQNMLRLEELNREFLFFAKSGNEAEANRCLDEMKTIKLYDVEEI